MQKLTTRPIWILILSALLFVVLADIAALMYMSAFLGLLRTPLQALPPLYWMLLFILVIVALVCAMMTVHGSRTRNVLSSSDTPKYLVFGPLHLGVTVGLSGLSFLIAFVINLTQPKWGATTALFLTVACIKLTVGYGFYKASQVLK